MARRHVPKVDQGHAAGPPAPLVGQRAGEASPQTNPGESNLRCTHFHTTLWSVVLEGRVSQQVCRVACERAPCPSEESPAHTHSPGSLLWLVVPTVDSAPAQSPTPFTQPLQGWLGSAQDVEAAQLFRLQSCTKLSVTALLAEKPFSPSSILCLSKQEAVMSLKGDSISAR